MSRRWLAACLVVASMAATTVSAATRFVSLGGDITETVYALHAEDGLLATDTTSQWPDAAARLPKVGYLRQLSAEGVLSLHPQLILATHDAGPATAVAQLRDAGVRMELLPVSRTPADVTAKILAIGKVLGRETEAAALARDVDVRFAALAKSVAAMPRHPRAIFLMSTGSGSPMAAGRDTAADRALALAGGHNAIDSFAGYKAVSPEAMVALAPDVIVLMHEREEDVGGVDGVLAMPGIAQTPAGRARRIVFVDGQALLGFGPRTAETAQALQAQWAAYKP
ncbi:iron complex transport system substrate-binding protein [Luteibacter rhizovicinus]|uniref:Iron complex transport system substrate-binding protein n=1 Tax=Luteibacter rhizovicinus TaxID=242606 RepID=A0A4R3YUV3_9GAMM|nr:hemin ABC transporter substrate-binding protein [Luteibacter rhizovicinus]TCV96196.1 iron complex transport system substrate-binding protein [Luteibacter rhizovicinus]